MSETLSPIDFRQIAQDHSHRSADAALFMALGPIFYTLPPAIQESYIKALEKMMLETQVAQSDTKLNKSAPAKPIIKTARGAW